MQNIRPKLRVARIHPSAKLPQYKTEKAACFDVHVVLDAPMRVIAPGEVVNFKTGLRFDIPEGWRLAVQGRSGAWFDSRLRLGNNEGIIDEDYTGELQISIHNCSSKPYTVNNGDRLVQVGIVPYYQADFEEISEAEIPDKKRGTKGLGSTGVK